MPPCPLHESRESSHDASSPTQTSERLRDTSLNSRSRDYSLSRRTFLAGSAAAATVGLAGCSSRLPGSATDIDATARIDGEQLLWDYPARAVEGTEDSDGIGYAAIRFRAVDAVGPNGSVEPAVRFRLNSTVGGIAAGESYTGYQADWFRFRLGVPRSYDNVAGLRAFVKPNQWPEIQTTYEYQGSRRDLIVHAPDVNSDGTITIEGRFRSPDTTLPRQVYCAFKVHASRPGLLGRSAVAAGREMFDLSVLDLPDGTTLQ